ncbi:MAG: hypothetical protein JEY99_07645 [Spirochaetales bacterium]|nr:hypothetical protein [Spirochaetales bacterium]
MINMKKLLWVFILTVQISFLSSQDNPTIEDRTVDAVSQWLMLEESGFFNDNYQRFFEKQVDEFPEPLFGINTNFMLGPSSKDTIPSLNLGFMQTKLGGKNLKFNFSASGSFINISNFLTPHESVEWIDAQFYDNNFIRYDIEASMIFFDILTLGVSSSNLTEFYKDPSENLPYSAGIQAFEYQKYTFNISNIDKLFKRNQTFAGLKRTVQKFTENFGVLNTLIVRDYSVPKLLNNVFFTGIPFMPLISTLYLPDNDEFMIEGSFLIPLGNSSLFIETGLVPLKSHLYKLIVRFDIMKIIFASRGEHPSNTMDTIFEASPDKPGMTFRYGPELSYLDYSFMDEGIFPYDTDMYMSDEGFNAGFSGGVYALNDKMLIGTTIRFLFSGIINMVAPEASFLSDKMIMSMNVQIYYR